jgi:beta-lactamase superfamily II metal-dependent hydrolase
MSFSTNKYEIDFLDVNDADAILIRCFHNNLEYIVLIDAGNISDWEAIKNMLKNTYGNTTIDLAICTHPDKDHIGGFFGLLDDNEITINEFWLIDPAHYLDQDDIHRYRNKDRARDAVRQLFNKPNDASQNLISKIIDNDINGKTVIAGLEHESIPIKVVAPTAEHYQELVKEMVADFGLKTYEGSDTSDYDESALPDKSDVKSVIDVDDDSSPYNASSIVILFEPGDGKKFLFTGDANCASLNDMIENCNGELDNISLLKVPHHGSKHNMTTEIIEKLKPKMSIVSAKGTKKHPSSGIVYWLSKTGNVYSTHKNGSLQYRSNVEQRNGYSTVDPLKQKKKSK